MAPAGAAPGARSALDAFAEAGERLGRATTLVEAAEAIVAAAAAGTGAELAVARVLDGAELRVAAVAAVSLALAAEVEGSTFPLEQLPAGEAAELERLPAALRSLAARSGARAVLLVPTCAGERPLGSLELLRAGLSFDADERRLARLAAAQLGLAIRVHGGGGGTAGGDAAATLELAGEALAAAVDEERTEDGIVRLAADATGALACLLWLPVGAAREPELVAAYGERGAEAPGEVAAARVLSGRDGRPLERSLTAEGDARSLVSIPLGQPSLGVLQLVYAPVDEPGPADLAALATFGLRAAQALRASRRSRDLALELDRTRALLAVVAQAISRLSLAHTLATAVERVAELLGIERVGIYLLVGRRLMPAAGLAVAGPHLEVAERLFELLHGRYRARGLLVVPDARADRRLGGLETELAESGIEAAVALPLHVRDEPIGLLALYPPRTRRFTDDELQLLSSLAAQLSVAVQNAQLHETATALGSELEQALASERQAARQLGALYEISRSFAQSLSLETTLEAVARTLVEALGVDAAAIRMPDPRNDAGTLQAVHVGDQRLAPAVRTIFERPEGVPRVVLQRLLRESEPRLLDARGAAALGGEHELLRPFLERGSTAALVPIATSAETLASLTLLSLDPERPIGDGLLEPAVSIAGQAALAIDNARLYQQQKLFLDMMQRSLLPREQPDVPGIELGEVYAPSAQVDVGGDVYDYLALDDGRLAVCLGDVTGHGVEATADMAMAKFVFRSLAREHPEPGDFLAHANVVVVGEVALGKFVTMTYLLFDPVRRTVVCASAGHPPPRVVQPDGSVTGLDASGLALGIDAPQAYESVEAPFEPGTTVVLYTDGVIEARTGGDLYGTERLDEFLSTHRELAPRRLANLLLEECRRFGGGELSDDLAVVVVRSTE